MRRENVQAMRVGLLVILAILALGSGVFLIGEQNRLFQRKHHYVVRFENVAGLQSGNPVQLNGVQVGNVERILLPESPAETRLIVELAIEQRYAQRIRRDSEAKIRTLGLLGDKYIEITSGSPGAVLLTPGEEIAAAPGVDFERMLISGEDVVADVATLSRKLIGLIERLEKGEGLIGELLRPRPTDSRSLDDSLMTTLASVERVVASVEQGEGPLGRLLYDQKMGRQLASSLERLETILTRVETGDGLLPALLDDAEMRQRVEETLAQTEQASTRLNEILGLLEEGDGLLPRLLNDAEYGEQVATELTDLFAQLNALLTPIAQGEGTLGLLIRDPEVYEAINDVIVGIHESKLLRWLIRNRQKAGIRQRYKEEKNQSPNREDAAESTPSVSDPPIEQDPSSS